jgi:mannose-1-phosphate guanylyltransferase
LLLPFLCLCSDAILIVTPSDHIIGSNGHYHFTMAEAIEKAAAVLLLLWDYS